MVASKLAKSSQISSTEHFLNFSLKSHKTSRVETVTSESIMCGLNEKDHEWTPFDEIYHVIELVCRNSLRIGSLGRLIKFGPPLQKSGSSGDGNSRIN